MKKKLFGVAIVLLSSLSSVSMAADSESQFVCDDNRTVLLECEGYVVASIQGDKIYDTKLRVKLKEDFMNLQKDSETKFSKGNFTVEFSPDWFNADIIFTMGGAEIDRSTVSCHQLILE